MNTFSRRNKFCAACNRSQCLSVYMRAILMCCILSTVHLAPLQVFMSSIARSCKLCILLVCDRVNTAFLILILESHYVIETSLSGCLTKV